MPAKKLPPQLVARLRMVSRQIDKWLGRMKNIDSRQNPNISGTNTFSWGSRVRQLNVSKTFPRVKLAIKRTHDFSAQETIRRIRRIVREHNKAVKPQTYVLVAPIAYPIGEKLIAMAKTDCPTTTEVFFGNTEKGRQFMSMLAKRGIIKENLREAMRELEDNVLFGPSDVFLLGINKEGKFVFMPCVDL